MRPSPRSGALAGKQTAGEVLESATSLGLKGDERIDISGLNDGQSHFATVTAERPDGTQITFQAEVLLLTPKEVEYFRHGGILHYVLRKLAKVSQS